MKIIGIWLIRFIGKILIIRGIWILINDFRAAILTFRLFPQRVHEWGIPVVLMIICASLIVPLLYIIGGVGILFLKRWARLLAFCGLWYNVLYSITSIATKWYQQFVLKTLPALFRPGDEILFFILVSSCLMALIEVIIIIFLSRPKVRENFS